MPRILWLVNPPRATLDNCRLKIIDDPVASVMVEAYLHRFCRPERWCPGCAVDLLKFLKPAKGYRAVCKRCQWAFQTHHAIDEARAYGPNRIIMQFKMSLPYHPNIIHGALLKQLSEEKYDRL